MIFKFTHDLELKNIENIRSIKKKYTFNNKVVFVNGFSASGKTMFAPILSSIENVESLIYPYEIEWLSSFLYSNKIDKTVYQEFIKQYLDHTIYNQMMSRNSNFRPSDVSSVLQSRKIFTYLARLFQKGDNLIPNKIKLNKPILNFTSSHLIFFINILAETLKDRLTFIETFRDPLYMFRQIKILYNDVYIKNPEKGFTSQVENDDSRLFFFDYYSKHEIFDELKTNNLNLITTSYLQRIFNFYFNFEFEKINMKGGKCIFLPFEKFVLKPDIWIDEIIKILNVKKTNSLNKELKKQKVPRKFFNQGLSRSVYKRYGNKDKIKKFSSLEDADKAYKEEISLEFDEGANDKLYKSLIDLSNQYREWINIFDKKFIF